jgi:voltage-gated potassium channel
VIVIGVGIFGTFTGFLANLFLTPRSDDTTAGGTDHTSSAATAPDDVRIEELRSLVVRQQQAIDEMVRLLERR